MVTLIAVARSGPSKRTVHDMPPQGDLAEPARDLRRLDDRRALTSLDVGLLLKSVGLEFTTYDSAARSADEASCETERMDPFYVVRDEVSQALGVAESLFSQWQNGDASVRAKLKVELRNIEQDIGDLEMTISQVESNRARFAVDDAELNSRRSFVRGTQATLSSMKLQLGSGAGDSSASARNGACSPLSPMENHKSERDSLLSGEKRRGRRQQDMDARNQEMIDDHAQQQQVQLQQQDQALDGLQGAVGRLKDMSGAINQEMVAQNRMLGDLEEGIDSTSDSLDELQRRMKKLLPPKGDRKNMMIITFLTVLLVILCVLVFSD